MNNDNINWGKKTLEFGEELVQRAKNISELAHQLEEDVTSMNHSFGGGWKDEGYQTFKDTFFKHTTLLEEYSKNLNKNANKIIMMSQKDIDTESNIFNL